MTELKTSIAMVLDRSGSMESCRDATVTAVNKYLLEVRADSALKEADFELMIFDSESIDTIRSGKPGEVADIAEADYIPRAATPLYDAIGRGVASLDVKAKDGKAVLVVVTDGLENHSRKYNFESITALVKERQEKGWLIVFLASGLEAAQQGAAMGIHPGKVARMYMDDGSYSAAVGAVGRMQRGYSSSPTMARARSYSRSAAFLDEERRAMGDETEGEGIVKPAKSGSARSNRASAGKAGQAREDGDAWNAPSDDVWGN